MRPSGCVSLRDRLLTRDGLCRARGVSHPEQASAATTLPWILPAPAPRGVLRGSEQPVGGHVKTPWSWLQGGLSLEVQASGPSNFTEARAVVAQAQVSPRRERRPWAPCLTPNLSEWFVPSRVQVGGD